jgi:hypothetical protein
MQETFHEQQRYAEDVRAGMLPRSRQPAEASKECTGARQSNRDRRTQEEAGCLGDADADDEESSAMTPPIDLDQLGVAIYENRIVQHIESLIQADRERSVAIVDSWRYSCEDWANPCADIIAEIKSGLKGSQVSDETAPGGEAKA